MFNNHSKLKTFLPPIATTEYFEGEKQKSNPAPAQVIPNGHVSNVHRQALQLPLQTQAGAAWKAWVLFFPNNLEGF